MSHSAGILLPFGWLSRPCKSWRFGRNSRRSRVAPLFRYSDTANARITDAAAPLADEALDTKFDMGPGSLRRTLLHIDAGERTWLARWMLGRGGGVAEPEWPMSRGARP